jgi:hypothetical protein
MEPWGWAVLAIVVIAVLGLGIYLWNRNRRTQQLTGRFGPEYERAVEETGDRRRAERELEERQERIAKMSVRPLVPDARDRFAKEWRAVQKAFVDDPAGSISRADRLVQEIMAERGFEADADFDRRAADVSVDHAQVVSDYRLAHDIAERHAADGVDTEELRQAMVHYRAVFEDLLESETPTGVEARS